MVFICRCFGCKHYNYDSTDHHEVYGEYYMVPNCEYVSESVNYLFDCEHREEEDADSMIVRMRQYREESK